MSGYCVAEQRAALLASGWKVLAVCDMQLKKKAVRQEALESIAELLTVP